MPEREPVRRAGDVAQAFGKTRPQIALAITMTLASRHHRRSAKHATSTTTAMTTGSVFNDDVATFVRSFHAPVRW